MFDFTPTERALFKRLSTPEKIQDFLDTLPANYEKDGETCRSVRATLQAGKAHCIEGAFIAAAALWYHGDKPLLLDLKSLPSDDDHVVALFKKNGYWGAISKTNHAVLRYRDPIYKTIRELTLSYFHEYYMKSTGKKTLRTCSKPFSLARYGKKWITGEEDLWQIAADLDDSPHTHIVPKGQERFIRHASPHERAMMDFTEWSKESLKT